MRRSGLFPIALVLALCAGVCDPGGIEIFPILEDRFSFEGGLEGWSVVASDLGTPAGSWSVAPSAEQSIAGTSSLKLSLDNTSGQGRLFVKRPFDLEPGSDYLVEVTFQLGSSDFGDVNLWNVVAAATAIDPVDSGGLVTVGTTANGQAVDSGVQWSERNGMLSVRTGPDSGRIWISVGVWGTTPFDRTYWIDDVTVTARLP